MHRAPNRRPEATLVALLLCCTARIAIAEPAPSPSDSPSASLARAIGVLESSLDEGQRGRACYAFDDAERFDLRLAPLFLEGLRLDQMSTKQNRALEAALATVLSPRGADKVATIRSLEAEVAELETGLVAFFMRARRDPDRYFLSLYGTPGAESPWGLRLDGHHLSLNWTAVPDAPLSVTPLFLGGQPHEVPEGLARAGLRVLAREEDAALAVLAGLDAAQRAAARVPFMEGSGIRRPMSVVEGERLVPPAAAGIGFAEVGPDARAALAALVDVALENLRPEVAAPYRTRLLATRDSWRFAFATPDTLDTPTTADTLDNRDGSDERPVALQANQPLYYRLQSDGFVIEFDNTSAAADHTHFVFREVAGDFGRDVLREHLAHHHGGGAPPE